MNQAYRRTKGRIHVNTRTSCIYIPRAVRRTFCNRWYSNTAAAAAVVSTKTELVPVVHGNRCMSTLLPLFPWFVSARHSQTAVIYCRILFFYSRCQALRNCCRTRDEIILCDDRSSDKMTRHTRNGTSLLAEKLCVHHSLK